MKTLTEFAWLPLTEELGEEIECEINFHWDNDGIGSYEYWGCKGYDAGHDYIEIDEINPQFTDQPSELISQIEKYIDDNYKSMCQDAKQAIDRNYNDNAGDF